MLGAERTEPLEEARIRTDESRVPHHRLDDHRGDPLAMCIEHPFHCTEVVVRRGERIGGGPRRDPRGIREPERRDAGARGHQEGITVPVIAPLELEELRAPRRRACQAHRAHRGFGSARDEAHHLDRRHQRDDPLREIGLEGAGCPEAHPRAHLALHRLHDLRLRVAEDHRAPGEDEVHVALAIGVPHVGPLRPRDEARRPTDRTEGAHRAAHPTRHHRARAREECLRLRGARHRRVRCRCAGRGHSAVDSHRATSFA